MAVAAPARRLLELAARLALFSCALLLALAAAEGLVRLALPAFDPAAQLRFVTHGELVLGPPDTSLRQTKNTGDYDVRVRFGPRGLRDARDVARAARDDVLVLGDSFAFGWGVEQHQRFSDRLEARTGLRVWNLGMPGQDLDGYEALLRHAERLGARARRLVVSLSVETDLREYGGARAPASERVETDGDWRARAKPWLARRSALYNLLTTAVHRVEVLEALAVRAGLVVPNLADAGVGPRSERVLTSVADRLATLAHGYDATVLLVPSRGLWLEREPEAEDALHRALVEALRARRLSVVDPRAAFEHGGRPLGHHFAKDGHWNARGHAVAAELLAQALSAPSAAPAPTPRAP